MLMEMIRPRIRYRFQPKRQRPVPGVPGLKVLTGGPKVDKGLQTSDRITPIHSSFGGFAVGESATRLTVTTSRGACRAPRATDSRSRLPVGARTSGELGFAAALLARSAQSERS